MKVVLRLDGRESSFGSALLTHNERLADPLDPFSKALAEITSKRKKTEADLLEIGHREFIGGLYTNGNGPCLPSWNILRCLQDGGRRHKRGKDVPRGVFPLFNQVDLNYDGPRDPEELWKDRETFSLRKGVGIGQSKVIRTRALFRNWGAELPIEIDPTIFDLEVLATIWNDAGKYAGIGDGRPIYGRFRGTILSEQSWLRQVDGDTDALYKANQSSIRRVLKEDAKRQEQHT